MCVCVFVHSLQHTLTARRQILFEKRLKAEKPQTSETGTFASMFGYKDFGVTATCALKK